MYPEQDTPFEILELWKPTTTVYPPEYFVEKNHPESALFNYLYHKTQEMYSSLPKRKNGEDPFIHPINIIIFLKKAGIQNATTLCVGLLHDYIEESVDLYKIKEKVEENEEGITQLDKYELLVADKLETDLKQFCIKNNCNQNKLRTIIDTTKLLTRHKRDYYYSSISGIFEHEQEEIREIAIQVKIADRTHNILCIEGFTEQARLFQCFKNLFILNNTKKYIAEKTKQPNSQAHLNYSFEPAKTERLFNKCAKATYCAFLTIAHLVRTKGISDITPMLQLAFKKYALEQGGLWAITEVNKDNNHLTRLYQGIIRKWDARLLHEWEIFEQRKQEERVFTRQFFESKNYTEEQITAIIDYKDAYSLKEVIAYLLYNKKYIIPQFLSSELDKTGRIIATPL